MIGLTGDIIPSIKTYLKKLVRENFHGFTFFYQYLGWRVFALFVMSFLVGLFDGFSLALFMPLLELIGSDERLATGAVDQLGSLSFLTKGFDYIGVPMRASYILLGIFLMIFMKSLFAFTNTYISAIFQQKLIKRIRLENIEAIQKINYESFVKLDGGYIQNSLSTEVERVNSAFSSYMQVLQFAIQILVYSLLALFANPIFAVLVIIGSLISNQIFNQIYKLTKSVSEKITQVGHRFHGTLIQFISNFKYLLATGNSKNYSTKLSKEVSLIEKEYRRIGLLNGLVKGIREPLAIGVVIFMILISINYLSIELSTIILSVLFLYRALTYVMNMQGSYNTYLSYAGSVNNLISFQNRLADLKTLQIGGQKFHFSESITVNDLSFMYDEIPILENINLTIKKNETVAFVGPSGSGKTTLINLLSNLLQTEQGSIKIDGININELDKSDFYKRVGYITQETVVFNDTVFNNISFWDEETEGNINRCKEVLEKSALLDFVINQPHGLNTRLGNSGINLSGGQRQRISIARELYKDIDILFLDEATSALDSETEKIIQKNIEDLKGQLTIIIVSHRLSTVVHADTIVYINNGSIEAIGKYDDLMKKSASFKSLVNTQNLE